MRDDIEEGRDKEDVTRGNKEDVGDRGRREGGTTNGGTKKME